MAENLSSLVPQGPRDRVSPTVRITQAAIAMAVLFVLVWLLEIVDTLTGHALDAYGIVPRDAGSLPEIFSAPFLHFGFDHLIANTLPLIVLGFFAALAGLVRFLAVTLAVIVVGGLGVWLLAPPGTLTAGASLLVFGYFGYLIARGIVDRRPSDCLVAALVVIFYGTMIFGVLPGAPGVSWQGHLAGLVGGVLAAWLLRRRAAPAAPAPYYRM